jgi:hypothetical protein
LSEPDEDHEKIQTNKSAQNSNLTPENSSWKAKSAFSTFTVSDTAGNAAKLTQQQSCHNHVAERSRLFQQKTTMLKSE